MIGLSVVAVFAIAAIGASAASAKTVLTLKTAKGPLPPGAPLSTFSSNLIFETTAGNLECEENENIATLNNNSSTKDKATINAERSEGNFDGIPHACKTSATGPVLITAEELPWPTEFNTKGQGKVKGSKHVKFTSEFLAVEGPNNHCTFEASTVKFTFNTSGPATITVTKQKFKHNTKAPNQTSLCPASGLLSGTYNVTSGGETVFAELESV
jgi:hypothetical protein